MHSIQTNGKYPGFSLIASIFFCLLAITLPAQQPFPDNYPVVWNSQSKNSSESMPCGGGDIGLNVWVENGDLYFYISRSGSFDENNALLKAGRVRVSLYPNPFFGQNFRQELVLQDGYVKITGSKDNLSATVDVWVDVFRPVVHVDVNSNKKIQVSATYENWRYRDRNISGKENNATSWKWAPPRPVVIYKDSTRIYKAGVIFHHRNRDTGTVFDATVRQQQLDSIKDQLYNPLHQLTFGGELRGRNMEFAGYYPGDDDHDFRWWRLKSKSPAREHNISVILHTAQAKTIDDWKTGLDKIIMEAEASKSARAETRNWWRQFWQRSFIYINPDSKDTGAAEWQAGRNYQLFRYMLGCNAFGKYPTKFNGGLFTYDPRFTDTTIKGSPDHRNWGGGTHTAQNQRLVYFPMLKSGDFDLMKPQFDFYMRILRNAELRSEVYWQHKGACFTEQMENFGLPNYAEYGTKRPAGYDAGMEYNAWLEYEWDTVLEFCWMMLETRRYAEKDISGYIPFIESCLRFFNEHYQYLAKKRGNKAFDANGHLVLYPGSAGETYKMAYNATSTIAALKTVLTRFLELPLPDEKKQEWRTMLNRIPPISFRTVNGYTTIAPALHWERINNTESMQLYPIFPWGIFGLGKPGLDTALNTWKHDTDAIKFRSHIGWKQDNIFAARLGLTKEAAALTVLKLKNSGRRFPAFWGPGYDWTPDHNWGGSGMIGLQEMLLQVDGKKILLFPAWPKEWDVHFKLHAPYNTTVEVVWKNGKMERLIVLPEEREKDVLTFPGH
jgi:hypothetical protein